MQMPRILLIAVLTEGHLQLGGNGLEIGTGASGFSSIPTGMAQN